VAVAAAIAYVAWRWVFQGGAGGRHAETRLRQICMGNEAQIERLIEAEIARTPGLSRGAAAARAVERYERDNR